MRRSLVTIAALLTMASAHAATIVVKDANGNNQTINILPAPNSNGDLPIGFGLNETLPAFANTPTFNLSTTQLQTLTPPTSITPLVSGDIIVTPSASFTRPANTTAYAAGQLVANSTTAGSVTPLSWTAARVAGGNFYIPRARMSSTGKNGTNAFFNLYLYSSPPTIANGDGAAWSTTVSSLVCTIPINLTAIGTDVAAGTGAPAIGSNCNIALASGQTLYGLLVANAAYTPISGEVETVTLEVHQN